MIHGWLKKKSCISILFIAGTALCAYAQMSFSGYVKDESGNRQADATVSLLCGGIQATTNSNGEFSLQADAVPQSRRYDPAFSGHSQRYLLSRHSLIIKNPLAGEVSLSLLDCSGRKIRSVSGREKKQALSLTGQSGMRIAIIKDSYGKAVVPLMCMNGAALSRNIRPQITKAQESSSANASLGKAQALSTSPVLFQYSPIRYFKAEKSGFVAGFAHVTSDQATDIVVTIQSYGSFASVPDRLNLSLPLEMRIKDALSIASASEKQAFLNEAGSVSTWGYSQTNMYQQCHHGMCSGGSNSVVFPSNINMGAMWDPELSRAIGSATADEGRALSDGAEGMNCFSPQVNMGFCPYWGRVIETFGEDPCLTGKTGSEYVRGLQGDYCEEQPLYLKAVANVKHFAVYGAGTPADQEEGMAADNLSERVIRDYFLPHFKECFAAGGSAGTMCSYTQINGTFACENSWLLKTVLREEWGYTGFVIADMDADQNFMAGCDVAFAPGSGFWSGATDADIDTGAARFLRSFIRAGIIFPDANSNPYASVPDVTGCAQHIALARQSARESMVLLKNENNVLPLSKNIGRIAVIGPHANAEKVSFADCNSSESSNEVIPLEGIRQAVSSGTTVDYAQCFSNPETMPDYSAAETAAQNADVAVVFVGIAGDAHPDGWNRYEAEQVNRSTLALPGGQAELIQRVQATGTPTIVVVVATQVTIDWAADNVDAIIWYGYPGIEGGHAIADILFGDYNPSGRLPITYYAKDSDLFSKASYDVEQGYTYRYFGGTPLYAFGHGLSYTNFSYSNLTVSPASPTTNDIVTVSVDVTNSGAMAGDEVVQLYVTDAAASAPVPIRKLQDFTRISLAPGATEKISFVLTPEQLSILTDAPVKRLVEPGDFLISVGGGQPVAGMTNYATKTVTVGGNARELPL